jgi:hypothetical protein
VEQLGAVETARRQIFTGVLAATAAFILVLLLITRAVRSSAPAADIESTEKKQIHTAQPVRIEQLVQQYWTNAAGVPELGMTGIIRNTGPSGIRSADMRCRFRDYQGEETFLEIPIISPTQLNDLDAGPLDAFSARTFEVRIADFPAVLQPEILGTELVNVKLSAF